MTATVPAASVWQHGWPNSQTSFSGQKLLAAGIVVHRLKRKHLFDAVPKLVLFHFKIVVRISMTKR